MWIELAPHPNSRPHSTLGVRAQAARGADRSLSVAFEVRGDVAAVYVPAPVTPSFTDDLWRRTCFEIFLARPETEAYLELNLAPSGAWAAYAFDAYRRRVTTAAPWPAPVVSFTIETTRLTLQATVPFAGPLLAYRRGSLQVGLIAVLEEPDAVSHWAAHHPPGVPDFHHPTVRTLTL